MAEESLVSAKELLEKIDETQVYIERLYNLVYEFQNKIKDNSLQYEPFNLSQQSDRDFLKGKWIRTKQPCAEYCINSFHATCNKGWCFLDYSAEELFDKFVFSSDGSPVGKKKLGF